MAVSGGQTSFAGGDGNSGEYLHENADRHDLSGTNDNSGDEAVEISDHERGSDGHQDKVFDEPAEEEPGHMGGAGTMDFNSGSRTQQEQPRGGDEEFDERETDHLGSVKEKPDLSSFSEDKGPDIHQRQYDQEASEQHRQPSVTVRPPPTAGNPPPEAALPDDVLATLSPRSSREDRGQRVRFNGRDGQVRFDNSWSDHQQHTPIQGNLPPPPPPSPANAETKEDDPDNQGDNSQPGQTGAKEETREVPISEVKNHHNPGSSFDSEENRDFYHDEHMDSQFNKHEDDEEEENGDEYRHPSDATTLDTEHEHTYHPDQEARRHDVEQNKMWYVEDEEDEEDHYWDDVEEPKYTTEQVPQTSLFGRPEEQQLSPQTLQEGEGEREREEAKDEESPPPVEGDSNEADRQEVQDVSHPPTLSQPSEPETPHIEAPPSDTASHEAPPSDVHVQNEVHLSDKPPSEGPPSETPPPEASPDDTPPSMASPPLSKSPPSDIPTHEAPLSEARPSEALPSETEAFSNVIPHSFSETVPSQAPPSDSSPSEDLNLQDVDLQSLRVLRDSLRGVPVPQPSKVDEASSVATDSEGTLSQLPSYGEAVLNTVVDGTTYLPDDADDDDEGDNVVPKTFDSHAFTKTIVSTPIPNSDSNDQQGTGDDQHHTHTPGEPPKVKNLDTILAEVEKLNKDWGINIDATKPAHVTDSESGTESSHPTMQNDRGAQAKAPPYPRGDYDQHDSQDQAGTSFDPQPQPEAKPTPSFGVGSDDTFAQNDGKLVGDRSDVLATTPDHYQAEATPTLESHVVDSSDTHVHVYHTAVEDMPTEKPAETDQSQYHSAREPDREDERERDTPTPVNFHSVVSEFEEPPPPPVASYSCRDDYIPMPGYSAGGWMAYHEKVRDQVRDLILNSLPEAWSHWVCHNVSSVVCIHAVA